MKKALQFGTVIAAAILVAVLLREPPRSTPPVRQGEAARTPPISDNHAAGTAAAPADRPLRRANLLDVRRVGIDFTEVEMGELRVKFRERFRPALEKWFTAYEGRVPFRAEQVTLDTFKERLGRDATFFLYTFVFDGVTLTFQDSNGHAKVSYMWAPKAQELNRLPQGEAPKLELPVSRQAVMNMMRADTGAELKPNDFVMRPSGVACALNGGAFVDLGDRLTEALQPPKKLSLVFGPDGNLVYYLRDPFF